MYSYLTRLKMSLFTLKFFLHNTTKGPPPRCLPQGAHHPRSTPACDIGKITDIIAMLEEICTN